MGVDTRAFHFHKTTTADPELAHIFNSFDNVDRSLDLVEKQPFGLSSKVKLKDIAIRTFFWTLLSEFPVPLISGCCIPN